VALDHRASARNDPSALSTNTSSDKSKYIFNAKSNTTFCFIVPSSGRNGLSHFKLVSESPTCLTATGSRMLSILSRHSRSGATCGPEAH
jgi:hypothetical protein